VANIEKIILTEMGRCNLEQAGLPVIFEEWLKLVEKQLGHYPNHRLYRSQFTHGRTPDQAIELVKADIAADIILKEVLQRCHEEYLKINPKAFPFGSGHIAECVAIKLDRCY
jgi:hypothetical protein